MVSSGEADLDHRGEILLPRNILYDRDVNDISGPRGSGRERTDYVRSVTEIGGFYRRRSKGSKQAILFTLLPVPGALQREMIAVESG